MRGEHNAKERYMKATVGSSPHARGAQRPALDVQGYGRIIPACAGSTKNYKSARIIIEDHPRMRGEHKSSLPVSPGR